MFTFIQLLNEDPRRYFAIVISVVISIMLHELAHGLMAIQHGDRTPIEQGRLTPNPLVHMGPMALIALFLVGISWGSMPIDPTRMRGKYAEANVALAGPSTNLLLAILSLVGLGLWHRFGGYDATQNPTAENLAFFLYYFGYINVFLAIFNLLPVPPLDGTHILANLSQGYREMLMKMGPQGATAMLVVVFLLAGRGIAPIADKVSVFLFRLGMGDMG